MTKGDCVGCYNDDYNHGLGGATGCWSFETAVVQLRRRVRMDEAPPWKAKPERRPSCYRQTGFIFVKPDQEY
jgi:hypothetical protein